MTTLYNEICDGERSIRAFRPSVKSVHKIGFVSKIVFRLIRMCLTECRPQFADGIGQMQYFGIQLRYKRFQAVDRV